MRPGLLLALTSLLFLAGCGGGPVCEGFKGGTPPAESPSQPQPAMQADPSER